MKSSVNLLPWSIRRRELLRRRARQWGALWACAAALAAAAAGARQLSDGDLQGVRRQAEERQNERVANAEKRLADARARLAAMREQEAALLSPEEEVPGLVVLGIVSRSARHLEDAIRVERLSLSRRGSPPPAQTPPARSGRKAPRLLTLEGIALDNLAIAAFATSLRDAGLFEFVERKLPSTPGAEEKPPVRFLIECHF